MSTVTDWTLLVETTRGIGQRKHTVAQVLGQVRGSREEALAELERHACRFVPEHPVGPKRRRLLRIEDGYLLVVDGSWQSFISRFVVGELLADSDAPSAPEPEAGEPAPEPVREEPADEPRTEPDEPAVPAFDPDDVDDDGIPVRPAWLGRRNLS